MRKKSEFSNRGLLRSYILLFTLFAICSGALSYILVAGDREITKMDEQVTHTYNVINNAQSLAMQIESMISSQRGFLLSKDEGFQLKFQVKKDKALELINKLTNLTHDTPSQTKRLTEIGNKIHELISILENRYEYFKNDLDARLPARAYEQTDALKDDILLTNSALLQAEYKILNSRIKKLELQKSRYFITLLISLPFTIALLVLFNGLLLYNQRKNNRMEASLKDSEERFVIAIEGTQDGIFDWDIRTGDVFFSKRIFGMLGYDSNTFFGTMAHLTDIMHPDDVSRFKRYTDSYLKGEISEYSQEFRLKNSSGRWMWVQSRAKAIDDSSGNPIRLVGAHMDITFTKENQQRLEMEKRTAEEANRAKSDFLAHMSHEIRTPLTAISGIAEIFERSNDNFNNKQKKLVKTLQSSTSALKDLINDILDFSKIESGELEFHEEKFRLTPLFEEMMGMMSMRAGEKGISCVFDYLKVRDVEFLGDRIRLRQIVVNLIGNAVKFTEKGVVSVKAYTEERQEKKFLRIDVSDTGIGIAPENFDLVFERFKQADASVSRKYGGTGLGLPISKNLALMMGGNIILTSELGKGSTFSLIIPFKNPQETEASEGTPAVARDESSKSTENNLVLLVEDYEGNAIVLGHLLNDQGYAFDLARTGLEAIDMWKKHKYKLVLMDIQMPQMDGFTATKAIRKIEKEMGLPHTCIVGMTAHALVGDKDKCIAAGMDSYLSKPIVESEFKQEMQRHLGT